MSDYATHPPTPEELQLWSICRDLDPRTGEDIKKKNKKILRRAWKELDTTSPAPTDSKKESDCLSEIDFDNPFGKRKELEEVKEETRYRLAGAPITYDENTMVTYRTLRERNLDPIMNGDIPEGLAFRFPYQWFPYNGERIKDGKGDYLRDPYGPLSFDVHVLIYNWWNTRLNNLYVSGGEWQGYYADGVGAGKNFFIQSRESHPEWYLFRLPIPDCYLTDDHHKENGQVVTMGPELTDEEIREIYSLARSQPHRYQLMFRHKLPNLVTMKTNFDLAISEDPEVPEGYTKGQINRQAVDVLRNMT